MATKFKTPAEKAAATKIRLAKTAATKAAHKAAAHKAAAPAEFTPDETAELDALCKAARAKYANEHQRKKAVIKVKADYKKNKSK